MQQNANRQRRWLLQTGFQLLRYFNQKYVNFLFLLNILDTCVNQIDLTLSLPKTTVVFLHFTVKDDYNRPVGTGF